MTDKELIDNFEAKHKDVAIAYGGDGTLLKVVDAVGTKKGIVPIRNYARCKEHLTLLEDICLGKNTAKELKAGLKYSKAPFLEAHLNTEIQDDSQLLPATATYRGIAEIVLKSFDPTEALRFSVVINNKTYMKQCIADGLIFSSKLGSHGYFKSVTRMLFTDNDAVGLGFIAPTYGICNLILKATDKVKIVLERGTDVSIAYDKKFETKSLKSGTEIELSQSCEGVALYGYDIFCCQACRDLRNSTTINDKYIG